MPLRFASLPAGAPGGVRLLVAFEVPPGPAWEPVRETFAARQGFVSAALLADREDRIVAVVHWSSPLMYARAVREEGDLIAALPFVGHSALYVQV